MKSARTDREGFALVAVLLFLLVAAAVITPFVLSARTDFLLASGTLRKDRQNHLADGILKLVARQVAASGLEVDEVLNFRSQPIRTICGNQLIDIRVQDQLSLVDLNAAPVDLLKAGFAAISFSSTDAGKLADLAQTFRSPDAEGAPGGRELSNGFKFAAFEAVEELYEFPGFQNMPVSQMTDVFTIYGRRETIDARNMPEALSRILPSGPTALYPFIVVGEEPSRFFRIEVLTRVSTDRTAGFAGMLLEIADPDNGVYRELERAVDPNIVGAAPGDFSQTVTCDRLFGEEVAEWLAGA